MTSPSISRLVADGERLIDFGELSDGQRAAIREDVQRGELGEPETQLAELAREADHELPPQGAAHRHPLADLADVPDAAARGKDRRGQVLLEASRDDAGRGGAGDRAADDPGGAIV